MMRRSGPGGGGGAGGFSKPPPAPLTHGGSSRVRLHTPEVNGSLGKDRFGSPRERSPSLVSSLPLSPSHPSSREKSPNPASQDLHDCSMCLSAYIQSLNTVCGTACRLSQCLAQVAAESGYVDSYTNIGQGATQPVREAADAWEGVARAVGVASAAVKTQMLVLLQEVQSRQDMSENARRQEINRVTQAMLSAFLGLQYQFSAVVIERFTGILQAIRDESHCTSSQNPAGFQINKPCQPSIGSYVTDISQLSVSSQYAPQLPVQPPWLPSQQQQQAGMKGVQAAPLLESPGKEDKARSRHPSSGHSRHSSTAPGWSNASSSVGCPSTTNYGSNSNYGSSLSLSMNSGNTLSPGTCYGLFSHLNGGGSGWHSDAISRRWSMGGPSAEGWERNSSLGPFSLIANRRWSVPEASEHDANSGEADSVTDFYGSCGLQGDWNGTIGGSTSWGSRVGLHVPSRDSSVTRSPSHSRSVTPDPGRQNSFISNEELQEVIDLLSLPLTTDANTVDADGVTLTKCSSGEEKPTLPLWTDGIGCERRNNTTHARDAPNRASWPAASTLLWAGLDGLMSEGEGEEGGSMSPVGLPQYRRHSTDTTHLNLGPTSPLMAKTRSSDNITVGSDMSSSKTGLDSNLQHLLLFNSILPASSPPTPTSQYSLFSPTS
ncbi:uncharacterized protein [Panulirus ornatus]|uniref:uncharacterized protein isoform X3 n=1 Tax=Panulirus ornatus TaxID=150431 RepID=UPI003A86E4FB